MNNSFILALSTLVGTVIGAGIFGLPYVVSKSGIIPGIFYFVVLGGIVMLLHLFFGEIVLRTVAKHRLIGYAEIYLGAWAKKLVTISTMVSIIGALLAYIIIAGNFLETVFAPLFSTPGIVFPLIFWAFLSVFILKGIQAISKMEFFMNIALFAVVLVIFFFAFPHIETGNFTAIDFSHIFLPYGVILFALAGWHAIPEIAELFKRKQGKRKLDNLIVWASLICGALYLLFVLFVVGVSGANTSKDALTGLIPFLGEKIVILGYVFGIIAIAASFLVLGNYLKNSLRHDYKMPYLPSAAIAIGAPMILFLLGVREFITVLGIVGIVMGAIEGSIIALVWRQAKQTGDREPEYRVKVPQVLVFFIVALLVSGAAAGILLR